jgi:hypothetical protein
MMDAQRKRPPGGGPGLSLAGGNHGKNDYSPFAAAAAKSLARELSIILMAADRMAAGHGLAWPDYDRLHAAHQYVLRTLADLLGREVLT